MASLQLNFLGVGGSSGMDQGSAAAVLEAAGEPILLIDCGQEVPQRFQSEYGQLPPAVFITHIHMDHVSGLEPLFFASWFEAARQAPLVLFVPAPIVPALQRRLVAERSPLAEGGVNFWDAFQLVPVDQGFWWRDRWFDVLPVNHHRPDFGFGLRLAEYFVYTGDTRPIPELLARYADAGEAVFHDCRPEGNPSHSGWDELQRDYPPELLHRLQAYHCGTAEQGQQMRAAGASVAVTGRRYPLPAGAPGD